MAAFLQVTLESLIVARFECALGGIENGRSLSFSAVPA